MTHPFLRLPALLLTAIPWLCPALAQDCVTPPPEKAIAIASKVFTGKVTKIEPVSKFTYIIHFDVTRQWKSAPSPKLQVLGTHNLVFGDPYVFLPGSTYLVYTQGPTNAKGPPHHRLDQIGTCAIRIIRGQQEIQSEEAALRRLVNR